MFEYKHNIIKNMNISRLKKFHNKQRNFMCGILQSNHITTYAGFTNAPHLFGLSYSL